jgi:hypothetical protein
MYRATPAGRKALAAAKIKVSRTCGRAIRGLGIDLRFDFHFLNSSRKGVEIMKSSNTRRDFLRTAAVVGTGLASKDAGFDYHLVKPADLEKIEELLTK